MLNVPVENSTRFRSCMKLTMENVEDLLCNFSEQGSIHCDINHIQTAKRTISRMLDISDIHDADQDDAQEEPAMRFLGGRARASQRNMQWYFMLEIISKIQQNYNQFHQAPKRPITRPLDEVEPAKTGFSVLRQ